MTRRELVKALLIGGTVAPMTVAAKLAKKASRQFTTETDHYPEDQWPTVTFRDCTLRIASDADGHLW